jgi:uncharacterized protein (DUF885 family)
MFRPWEFDGAHQNMEEDLDVEQVHNAPEEDVRDLNNENDEVFHRTHLSEGEKKLFSMCIKD